MSSKSFNVRKLLKLGSYNSSRCTYLILNCAYLVLASLNSLYISLNVLHVVEISAAALNRSFTVPAQAVNAERSLSVP